MALFIAKAIQGARNLENPLGEPWFISVILVSLAELLFHKYVVSIGKGPSTVRITNFSLGTNSTIS